MIDTLFDMYLRNLVKMLLHRKADTPIHLYNAIQEVLKGRVTEHKVATWCAINQIPHKRVRIIASTVLDLIDPDRTFRNQSQTWALTRDHSLSLTKINYRHKLWKQDNFGKVLT